MAVNALLHGPGHVLACLAPLPLNAEVALAGATVQAVGGAVLRDRRGRGWSWPCGRMGTSMAAGAALGKERGSGAGTPGAKRPSATAPWQKVA